MAKTVPYCDVDLPVRSHDVAKANELMEKAGWSMGKDGYRYKDGKKCVVTIYYNSNNAQERTISEYMQNDLKKIGVELKDCGRGKSRRFWIGSVLANSTCNTPCRGGRRMIRSPICLLGAFPLTGIIKRRSAWNARSGWIRRSPRL